MLKVEELFNRQLLIELRSEKVATECAVDALDIFVEWKEMKSLE